MTRPAVSLPDGRLSRLTLPWRFICFFNGATQRRQPYALLDVDFLGWGIAGYGDDAPGNPFMLRNLAAVVSNYREGGISVFVLAHFVSGQDERGA